MHLTDSPLVERESRWKSFPRMLTPAKESMGDMSIDQSVTASLELARSATDSMTQEYGRYFGLKTGTFRGGCLQDPLDSSAELHEFLAYLIECAVTGKPYTIHGYKKGESRCATIYTRMIS